MPYASDAAVEFADRSMEAVCYYAYWASTELAEERGRYASLQRQPVGPRHPAAGYAELLRERARRLCRGRRVGRRMDWDALRARIKQHGMRNSNCIAIAPTATISNIIGVSASHRARATRTSSSSRTCRASSPSSTSIWSRDLKALGPVGRSDGRRPQVLRRHPRARSTASRPSCASLYATAFEVEPRLAGRGRVRAARNGSTRRSRSTSTWPAHRASKLDDTYKLAWLRGLKTTYYLRTMGATSAEKSTGRAAS